MEGEWCGQESGLPGTFTGCGAILHTWGRRRSAVTSLGLLFLASAVTLLCPRDAASFIRLAGQVLPSNMDSSHLACLAPHCSPSPCWSSALVADCPPYIPSCTLSSLFSCRASGAVKRAEPYVGPGSPPLYSGSSLPISAPGSLPVFPGLGPCPFTSAECFPRILCLPTQMAPSQVGHSQALS